MNLAVTSSYGRLVNTRVIRSTIGSTGRGTGTGNVRGTQFVYKSTSTTTFRLRGRNLGPSYMVLSPPEGNYNRRLMGAVSEVSPDHMICMSYSPTALTESLGFFARGNCAPGRVAPYSVFSKASRMRDITLVREGWRGGVRGRLGYGVRLGWGRRGRL